ncbi:MAG TPA: hypothetical protein VKE98_07235, partial [Gemmataceae bacterium]|nr:hypothetical protein [Gemmataceae bacterium]
PSLRQQAPALVNRLAACFFWAIVNHGNPEDRERYLRVFGAPADDPKLHRLSALALEHRNAWEPAHLAWQELEAEVEKNPAWGSPEQRNRVRALIWSRMGENADAHSEHAGQLPTIFQRFRQKERPLKPAAEQCFKKSLTLAPDQLEAHQALFLHYQDKDKAAKALKAGADLLARFPDHALTLEAMGDLSRDNESEGDALSYYQRAVAVNPLEKRLRNKVGAAQLTWARALACTGKFDDARAQFQAVLSRDEPDRHLMLCKWAACEFKAQNQARAEELILQARPEGRRLLETAYALAIEAVRYQLPAPLRKRFAGEFNLALQEPASVETACRLLVTAGSLRSADVAYHGQQTHEKKVLAYLRRAIPLDWTAEQMESACETLLLLDSRMHLKRLLHRGIREFPDNPIFFLKEAEVNLIDYGETWKVSRLLEHAGRLTQDLPRGERQEQLLEKIRHLQEMAGDADRNHPMNIFGRMMDMMDELDDDD